MKKIAVLISAALLTMLVIAGQGMIQDCLGYALGKGGAYFSESVKTMEMGQAFTFEISGVKPDGKSVIWLSSNPDIARVNQKGRVTAAKIGRTMITARLARSGRKISREIMVTEKKG